MSMLASELLAPLMALPSKVRFSTLELRVNVEAALYTMSVLPPELSTTVSPVPTCYLSFLAPPARRLATAPPVKLSLPDPPVNVFDAADRGKSGGCACSQVDLDRRTTSRVIQRIDAGVEVHRNVLDSLSLVRPVTDLIPPSLVTNKTLLPAVPWMLSLSTDTSELPPKMLTMVSSLRHRFCRYRQPPFSESLPAPPRGVSASLPSTSVSSPAP
jgi:hypothetical protein